LIGMVIQLEQERTRSLVFHSETRHNLPPPAVSLRQLVCAVALRLTETTAPQQAELQKTLNPELTAPEVQQDEHLMRHKRAEAGRIVGGEDEKLIGIKLSVSIY